MPLLEKFESWSYRLFGGITPFFLTRVFHFKNSLERARIKIYPETYVSLMFFVATLTIPVSVISTILFLFYGFMPLLFLVPVPFYVIVGFMVMPKSKASDRASGIERDAFCRRLHQCHGFGWYCSLQQLQEVV